MPWTTRGTQEDKETTEEIERQEDRAAAIIAAAYFENRLMLAIQERLEDDAKVINSFFQNMGPLASFSAKIDLAYLMRIITADIREKLHTIRRIRNEFAHNLAPLTFESPKIRSMCEKNFIRPSRVSEMRRLWKEDTETEELLKQAMDSILKEFEQLTDTPRNWFMITLKYLLFLIELQTFVAENMIKPPSSKKKNWRLSMNW